MSPHTLGRNPWFWSGNPSTRWKLLIAFHSVFDDPLSLEWCYKWHFQAASFGMCGIIRCRVTISGWLQSWDGQFSLAVFTDGWIMRGGGRLIMWNVGPCNVCWCEVRILARNVIDSTATWMFWTCCLAIGFIFRSRERKHPPELPRMLRANIWLYVGIGNLCFLDVCRAFETVRKGSGMHFHQSCEKKRFTECRLVSMWYFSLVCRRYWEVQEISGFARFACRGK